MTVETATYITALNNTLPTSGDPRSEGDDHLRLIKAVLLGSFPAIAGAVTVAHTDLNTVTAKANTAGQVYTGAHDFTAGSAAVPTATLLDNTTKAASTQFVQTAIAAVNSNTVTVMSIQAGAGPFTATAGQHIVVEYAGAAVTVNLPATPAAGNFVFVTLGNGRTDNVIGRNGSPIMSTAQDMTVNMAYITVQLRYVDSTIGWTML